MRYFGLFIFISIIISCTEKQEWVRFESPDKDFELLFPQTPKEQSQLMNSDFGPIKMNMFVYEAENSELEENLFYGLTYIDYPKDFLMINRPEEIDSFFYTSVQNSVFNVHGILTNEKIISLKKYPGREIRISFNQGKGIINSRFYLVGRRLIMMQVITEQRKDFNKSINNFFNSFKLTK